MTEAEGSALSIGAVAGGTRASRAWEVAVKRLGKRVIEMRAGVVSPLNLNVVFQIPGELSQPNFTGVRTGRFLASEPKLLVQVALPPEPVADADAEALELLGAAVSEGERFAAVKGISDAGLAEIRQLVKRVGTGG